MSATSLSQARPEPSESTLSPSEMKVQITLATKDNLGAALTKQGRCDEAETLLREVWEARKQLGQTPSDEAMLRTMNNLAAALSHQGHFAEAETLQREVLETDEQTLGREHRHTLSSMNNLAACLTRQGKLEEAQELLERALESSRKVHGAAMDPTLAVMGNLGDNLLRQGKYEQAEEVSREVLALRQKVLPARHPGIAESMHNLAAVLSARGKLDEADALKRQQEKLKAAQQQAPSNEGENQHQPKDRASLQEEVTSLPVTPGKKDAKTLRDMNKLGDALIREGKYREAERVLRETLVMCE